MVRTGGRPKVYCYCGRPSHGHGLCDKHYKQACRQASREQRVVYESEQLVEPEGPSSCVGIGGPCGQPVHKFIEHDGGLSGLCVQHFREWERLKAELEEEPVQSAPPPQHHPQPIKLWCPPPGSLSPKVTEEKEKEKAAAWEENRRQHNEARGIYAPVRLPALVDMPPPGGEVNPHYKPAVVRIVCGNWVPGLKLTVNGQCIRNLQGDERVYEGAEFVVELREGHYVVALSNGGRPVCSKTLAVRNGDELTMGL